MIIVSIEVFIVKTLPTLEAVIAHPYLYLTTIAGVTTTAAGLTVGIQGDRASFGGSSTQNWERPLELFITATAASSTATVQVQESQDASSWTTVATLNFLSNSNPADTQNYVHALKKTFLRINVSAISGKTITGYLIMR